MQTLRDDMKASETLLASVRVQYAESALAYSLRNLGSSSADKKPSVMRQIITDNITKLNQKVPASSKAGEPAAGEMLIHPVLLDAAKKHI